MANQDHLIDLKDVPEDVADVTPETPLGGGSSFREPAEVSQPSALVFGADRTPSFFSGSMPPQLQLDSAFSRARVMTDRIPRDSLMPLGVQGNPSTNAAIQSTATKVIQTPGVAPNSGFTAISFTGPKEAVITGSPAQPPSANIVWTWAAESAGSIFQAPGPGLSSYEGSTISSGNNSVAASVKVTQTPTTATSLGLFWQDPVSSPIAPSGWTSVTGGFYYKAITGTAPVTVGPLSLSGLFAWSLSLFSGPAPALVQSRTTGAASGTLAFTSPNTAGNTLVVVVSAQGTSGISQVISDSQHNTYSQIVSMGANNGSGTFIQDGVWVAPNCAGGSNTVTWSISGTGIFNPQIIIMEFGALPVGPGIPLFTNLNTSSIPPINLNATGNGGVGGILPVPNGGTGLGTLPAHQIVLGEGTAALGAVGFGTSGQVLTSNGAGVDPTFQGVVVQVATTSLSSAQILALQTTPVTLVAAPGAQLTIVPVRISIIFFGGTVAYTDAGGAVSFNIGSATQALASNAIFTTAASPNKQIQRLPEFAATDTSGNPPTDENAAMTISKATNNFAAGNGTAKVIVHYVVMPTV